MTNEAIRAAVDANPFDNDIDLELACAAQDGSADTRRRCLVALRLRMWRRRGILASAGLRGDELDAAAPTPRMLNRRAVLEVTP